MYNFGLNIYNLVCLFSNLFFFGLITVFEMRPTHRTMTDLKLLQTDWFQNLSSKFTLKQIVKTTVQFEKSWFGMTGFKSYLEHC